MTVTDTGTALTGTATLWRLAVRRDRIRLTVDQGVSEHAAGTVLTSLIAFTLVYAALGVVWFWLIRKYAMEGPQEHDAQPPGSDDDTDDTQPKQLSFAY